MMRNALLIMFLLCGACGTIDRDVKDINTKYPPPPSVPDLPDSLKEECPALKLIKDGSIKSLVEASASDPILYSDCKKRHGDVVDKYLRVKREQDSYAKQIELFNKTNKVK